MSTRSQELLLSWVLVDLLIAGAHRVPPLPPAMQQSPHPDGGDEDGGSDGEDGDDGDDGDDGP